MRLPQSGGTFPPSSRDLDGSPLKILLTADPELPVPPLHYGGIERVIDMLARALEARGHEVVLLAHHESTCPVRTVRYAASQARSIGETISNAALLSRTVLGGGFDIVHSFSRLAYLAPILPWTLPKLMTYQRPITRRTVTWAHRLSRGTLSFSAISRDMIRPVADVGSWHLVYNGVPIARFDPVTQVSPDAPLVFLGRIEPIKGTHLAIEVAKQSGSSLIIAGNIPSEHMGYFEKEVAPHLEGETVRYVGPVDDIQKNALLGSARAFLMPIQWDEPFGIVMAEALACGTPVVGIGRGSVPEVVDHGVTGFVCRDVDEMVAAVARVPEIDRRRCRMAAETRYSDGAIADAYVGLYRDLVAGPRAPLGAA